MCHGGFRCLEVSLCFAPYGAKVGLNAEQTERGSSQKKGCSVSGVATSGRLRCACSPGVRGESWHTHFCDQGKMCRVVHLTAVSTMWWLQHDYLRVRICRVTAKPVSAQALRVRFRCRYGRGSPASARGSSRQETPDAD